MRKKRFMSFFISLVMVFSMLPAFPVMSDVPDHVTADGFTYTDYNLVLSQNRATGASHGADTYLTTEGSDAINWINFNMNYNGTFGDQHMQGLEMYMHGHRIITAGDIHFLPTAEQWDATPAPTRGTRTANAETKTLTTPMTYTVRAAAGEQPAERFRYNLISKPDPLGGIEVTVELLDDMPEDLLGFAQFYLEFYPNKYRGRTYMVDADASGTWDEFGIFPFHPQDDHEIQERPDLPNQVWYVKDWNLQRGNSQVLPMATGKKFNMAPDDEWFNVVVTSKTGDMSLSDGRNRAQNGWFNLGELFTSNKAGSKIVWNISPKVKPDWKRDPNVAFSQAGYSSEQEKYAVIELDMYDTTYPKSAELYRLNADGTSEMVLTDVLKHYDGTPDKFEFRRRYNYMRFNFTDITDNGMYYIKYGDQKTEVFPIAHNVYDRIWQTALNGYIAVQMDHIEVREGDKLWHGVPHMDDSRIAGYPTARAHTGGPGESEPGSQEVSVPILEMDGAVIGYTDNNTSYFDGVSVSASVNSSIAEKGYGHGSLVPNLNVGGWYDAGDFDLQLSRHTGVLTNLTQTAIAFDDLDGMDAFSAEWDDYVTGGIAEMHKSDGVPDIITQITHGSKVMLAYFEELGGIGGYMEFRSLREYTHLGDPSTTTDGFLYDPTRKPSEIIQKAYPITGEMKMWSGRVDDRVVSRHSWVQGAQLLGTNSANFAAAAYLLKGWGGDYDDVAQRSLDAALRIWAAHAPATPTTTHWNTMLYLMMATDRFREVALSEGDTKYADELTQWFDFFKGHVQRVWNNGSILGTGGSAINTYFTGMFVKDLVDEDIRAAWLDSYKNAVLGRVNAGTYSTSNTVWGLNWQESSSWGPVDTLIGNTRIPSILYRLFPEYEVIGEYVLRSVNYTLGRHPMSNISYLSGVGTKSHTMPYNSNRADESYIPGSILPGYTTHAPDLNDYLDDYPFIWFQNESIVSYGPNYLPVAYSAMEYAKRTINPEKNYVTASKDFHRSFAPTIMTTNSDEYGSLGVQGFSLYMHENHYDSSVGDKKNAGIEIIQNGRRIATNGDLSMVPVNDQWLASPTEFNSRGKSESSLYANLKVPAQGSNEELGYTLTAEPITGGIRLRAKLNGTLPDDLEGKAGFSLEFNPGEYIEKSFYSASTVDGGYDFFGVFPLTAIDSFEQGMKEIVPPRMENQPQFVQDYVNKIGFYQPKPFASGKKFTFSPEDPESHIRIESKTNNALELYDGRMRSTNGWFVLRSEFEPGQTEIVWEIYSNTDGSWIREPSVSFNQAGYKTGLEKVAIIEFDSNDTTSPGIAYLDRLNFDGTYTEVLSQELSAARPWMRYKYRNFNFSAIEEKGLYAIRYNGERTDVFPIAQDVYDNTWQASLGVFMPVSMDHMTVREGYKIWQRDTNLDDALMAPKGLTLYGDWKMDSSTDATFGDYDQIPGLNTGGWLTDGYNTETDKNADVIQDLALAVEMLGVNMDTTYIEWDNNFVELKRNDGDNDVQQQIEHGVKQLLAQITNIGYSIPGLAFPTLQQYITAGDGSRNTDRYRYDPDLELKEISGLFSGKLDDRLAFAGKKDAALQLKTAAALAAAGYALKIDDYKQSLADTCLLNAERIWRETNVGQDTALISAKWNLAVELILAESSLTNECMTFLSENALQMFGVGFMENGWRAARIFDNMPDSLKADFSKGFSNWYDSLLLNELNNPFEVYLTGKSADAIEMGMRLAVLYNAFPEKVDFNFIAAAQKYMLGNHMANSATWIHGGNALRTRAEGYGPNRGNRFFVGGGIVNGYVEALPGFAEATDKYALIQTQTSYDITSAAKWIVLANSVIAEIPEKTNISLAKEDGKALAGFNFAESEDDIKALCLIAVYDTTGRLVDSAIKEVTVEANMAKQESLAIGLPDGYEAKVFIWRIPLGDYKDMYIPMCAAASIKG